MNHADFKMVITPKHRLLDLHLKEIYEYRDLVFLSVKRDFTSRYKQTILGPLWAIIQPLLTTVVFTIIFGRLAHLTNADAEGDWVIPGFLFYMAGSIMWGYFSSTLSLTSNTFHDHRSIMGKVYYPRVITPISIAFSGLISFVVQFTMFFVIWLFFVIRGGTSISVTPMLLLVPLLVFQMVLLSVGFGIMISSLTTKYRDMTFLVAFGLQLWQYGSPIAYGLQLVPEKWLGLYMLNPVTPIVTTFRYAMFGFGYFSLGYYLIGWGVSLLVFVLGLIMFSRVERTFMDTV